MNFTATTAKGDFYNEICYTGGVYDNTTGLYYLNARYYDPDDGRFVTQDTYRGDMNDPSSLHLYAYCANNPVNYVDPSGQYVISVGLKAEAAAILGGYSVISVNTDKKYLTLCLTTGCKVITNIAASVSLVLSYYGHKSISALPGWGFSTGISFCYGIKLSANASVSVTSSGKIAGSGSAGVGVGGALLPIPYWDTELGYTKQLYKWKIKSVSKKKKTYTMRGKKITTKRVGGHTEVTFVKNKRKTNIYNSGKVVIKRC